MQTDKCAAAGETEQTFPAVTILRYGNTNTCFLRGGLLIDTDYAGRMRQFYREIKKKGIRIEDIRYVLATHYHPDHTGLIGELIHHGVRLLLMDFQMRHVHDPDEIFQRDHLPFVPINELEAVVISSRESHAFLKSLGISGEIIPTPSHSQDSLSVVLDDGCCIVGDLEPLSYLESYDSNHALASDWDELLRRKPVRIIYAHANEQKLLSADERR